MQISARTFVGALLCALFIFASEALAQTTSLEVLCQPDQHFKGMSDSAAIQSCLNLAASQKSGSTLTVLLESRIYHIDAPINITGPERAKVVLRGASCDRKPTLLASAWLGNQRILYGEGYNYEIRCLIADGNKLRRDYSTLIPGLEDGKPTAHQLCNAEDWRPANIVLTGTDVIIELVETVNAPCGAALGIIGARITVRRIRASSNGFEAPKLVVSATGANGEERRWPGYSHQLSDGITVVFCRECQIIDNILEENTDLALVLGGGPNNVVRGNHCIVKSVYALGCFSVGRFSGGFPEWEGNHAGLVFEENTVSASEGTVVYGLTVGSYFYCHSTNPDCKYVVVHDAGIVRRNRIAGAKINAGLHGVEAVVFTENEIGEALSEAPNFFVPCRLKERYVVGFVKAGVVLQPGAKRVIVFGSECK